MKKDVKYVLTEKEYEELKYKLGLLVDSVREEKIRLEDIENKSDSEVISSNIADYNMSLLHEICGLALQKE